LDRGESSALPEPPLGEPAVNIPVFVTSLAKARVHDGALHLAFFVEIDGPDMIERIINLRVAMQASAWHATRQKIDEALAAFKRTFNS
jgi:hypothetical protein